MYPCMLGVVNKLHFGGLKNQTAVFVDIYPDGVYNTNTLWGYV